MEDEIELEHSTLCQQIERDGRCVQVEIFRDKNRDEGWLLEIVDLDTGSSVVWDELFETDRKAFELLLAEIADEGLDKLIDNTPKAQLRQ